MAIQLQKGQKINLEKNDGSKLLNFCVGCNWGAIQTTAKKFFGLVSSTETKDVDLDLSCILFDEQGKICDHIYSPLYKKSFLSSYNMPQGKLDTVDHALHHSGDDLSGDTEGDDGLDNEIIQVDLTKISPTIFSMFFFLNNCGSEDFSQIPYASIRMYEGTPSRVKTIFAQYNVSALPQYAGKKALIMGKLYRRNGVWRFGAIGDAFADDNICVTIERIARDYAR